MDIKKYHPEDLDEETTHKIATLIKKSFDGISYMYSENNPFKAEVEGDLEKILKEDNPANVFYVIEDAKNDIVACLRGFIKEKYLNPEMGHGNAFFSKYVGVKELRTGLGRILKEEFERDAIQKAIESQLPSLVIGRVSKKNDVSIKWNLANGYKERKEGPESEYNQYYKAFYPKDFKGPQLEENNQKNPEA